MSTKAQVIAVEGMDDIASILKEHGIEQPTDGTMVPIVIPIDSLDDLPVALANLGQNSEKVSASIRGELEKPEPEELEEAKVAALLKENEILREDNQKLLGKVEEALRILS